MSTSDLSFGRCSILIWHVANCKRRAGAEASVGGRAGRQGRPLLGTAVSSTHAVPRSRLCSSVYHIILKITYLDVSLISCTSSRIRSGESRITHCMRCIHIFVLNLISTGCIVGYKCSHVSCLDTVRQVFYSL